jgi:virginiamycin B lyase
VEPAGSAWQKQDGKLKQVSVAADGTVWGTNAGNNIFRRAGNRWERRPGALAQVSAGSASIVWGVNAGQQIYQLK